VEKGSVIKVIAHMDCLHAGLLKLISHNGAIFRPFFNLNRPSVQWAPGIPSSSIRQPECDTE
jgi:hypothetical protein